MSILQASNIVYLLQPYHSNVIKRAIKTPKVYFLDTGLCAFLTGWPSPEAGALAGNIFETFVVTEIIKSYWYTGKQCQLFFYRDREGREIDLLIAIGDTLYPVEIKKTAAPSKKHIKYFSVLDNLAVNVGDGALVCLVDKTLPITDRAQAVPVTLL